MPIYVRNLLYEAGQDDLRQAFSEHGVKSVQLWMSGFAFTPSGSSHA